MPFAGIGSLWPWEKGTQMDINVALKAGKACRALRELADGVSSDLTIRQISALLYIASRPDGVTQQQLADAIDTSKAATAKLVAALSSTTGDIRRDGLGMVNVDLNPNDLRSRILTLSKAGEKMVGRFVRALGAE